MLGRSLVVRPHTQDAHSPLFGEHLVHDSVLNIDAPRVCTHANASTEVWLKRNQISLEGTL